MSRLNRFFSLHYFVFANTEFLLMFCAWLVLPVPSFCLPSNNCINSHHTNPWGSLFFRLAIVWPSYSYPLNSWSWPSERERPAHFCLVLFAKDLVIFLLLSTTHHPAQGSVWMVVRPPWLQGAFVQAINSISELTHNVAVPFYWPPEGYIFRVRRKTHCLTYCILGRQTVDRTVDIGRTERDLLSHQA